VSHQRAIAEALGEVLRLDDDVAQAGAWRNLDLVEIELARLLRLGGHLLVPVEPGALLGLASLGVGPHPLEFVLESALTLGVLLAFYLQAGLLGLQVRRVVALVAV